MRGAQGARSGSPARADRHQLPRGAGDASRTRADIRSLPAAGHRGQFSALPAARRGSAGLRADGLFAAYRGIGAMRLATLILSLAVACTLATDAAAQGNNKDYTTLNSRIRRERLFPTVLFF